MINTSLNSPMTMNLLNLQSITQEQASVQQKLATGLKVSSPLHNPNAYYTAITLHSQAQELNSFMDALGQSVQALKNIDNTINTGINFLEQALATARVALGDLITNGGSAPVPTPPDNDITPTPPTPGSSEVTRTDLENIMKDKGISGKVVTNQAEFIEAVNNAAAGDTIAILGKIDFYNASFDLSNITITGADGLIRKHGLEDQYYVKESDRAVLNFRIDGSGDHSGFVTKNNVAVSDLALNYEVETSSNAITYQMITNSGILDLENVSISLKSDNRTSVYNDLIENIDRGATNIKGKVNIDTNDNRTYIFHNSYFGQVILDKDATLNVVTKGDAVTVFDGGKIELYGTLNANADANNFTLMDYGNNIIGGRININSLFKSSFGLGGRSNITLLSTADIRINTGSFAGTAFSSGFKIKWESGAQITSNETTNWKAGSSGNAVPATDIFFQGSQDLSAILGWNKSAVRVSLTAPSSKPQTSAENELLDYLKKETDELASKRREISLDAAAKRYNSILDYYNDLIGTNSYMGKNLLQDEAMTVKFSTGKDNRLDIKGRNIQYEKLGLNQANWEKVADIEKSIDEVQNALADLRRQGREFSNYNSIITSRDDFMGTLSNILTEGADKLTLADVNEESANMLALSSRQMLATNALSLAAQSSRSILSLF